MKEIKEVLIIARNTASDEFKCLFYTFTNAGKLATFVLSGPEIVPEQRLAEMIREGYAVRTMKLEHLNYNAIANHKFPHTIVDVMTTKAYGDQIRSRRNDLKDDNITKLPLFKINE